MEEKDNKYLEQQLSEEDVQILKEIVEKEKHMRWLGKTIRVLALWLTGVIMAAAAVWGAIVEIVKHAVSK